MNEPEAIERARPQELRSLQLERLRWSIHHAYQSVPHYREKFEANGLHPEQLKQLGDLRRFPFTTKEDLRQNHPFGMLAVPAEKLARLHASSGTTGVPTVVGYTRGDLETWSRLMARCLRAAGARPGDRIHIALGYGLFTGGLGAHSGAEALGACAIPVGTGRTERQVQLIRDLRPDVLFSTPSYALVIADELERQGLGAASSLRVGLFGAEPWSERMRGEIERRLGIDALDLYGLSEVIGPGVAQECSDARGALTVWEDHFYPEIVDPQSGEPLPDGETGELVLTSLTREALPVIRYRTRDLSSLSPGTTRPMRRLARIAGRSDDMLILRGVNVFPGQIEECILERPRLAPHYRLELRRERHLDALDVVVELRPGAFAPGSARDGTDRERVAEARALERSIQAHVGVAAQVRLVDPGTLERSEGKARRVLDLRPHD